MADEGQKKNAKMPGVGTIFLVIFTTFVLVALVGGIFGCVSNFDLAERFGVRTESLKSTENQSSAHLQETVARADSGGSGASGAGVPFARQCSLGFLAFTLNISGWFLGIAGVAFDLSLSEFVVHMGSLFSPGASSGANFSVGIKTGWVIMRDLMNFIFIVMIVYAAISMILGLNAQKPGQLIVKILIAAILVNFSYLFGAVIVDASNFVSKKIYDEAISFEGYEPPTIAFGGESFIKIPTEETIRTFSRVENAPVTGRFMQATQLASIYNWKADIDADRTNGNTSIATNDYLPFLLGSFGLIFFSLAAGIFAVAAIFITIRFAVIALLLMLAPLGMLYFIGLQPLAKWGKTWWDTLLGQAFFPVAFLFLIGISFKFVETGMNSLTGGASFYDLLTVTGDGAALFNNFNLVLIFMVTWVLLYLSLQMASNLAQGKFDYVPPSPAALYKGAAGLQGAIGKLNPVFWGRKGAQWVVGEGIEYAGDRRIPGTAFTLRDVGGWLRRGFPGMDELEKVRQRNDLQLRDGWMADIRTMRESRVKSNRLRREAAVAREAGDKEKAEKLEAEATVEDEKYRTVASRAKQKRDGINSDNVKKQVYRYANSKGWDQQIADIESAAQITIVSGLSPGGSAYVGVQKAADAVASGDNSKIVEALNRLNATQTAMLMYMIRDRFAETKDANNIIGAIDRDRFNNAVAAVEPDFFSNLSVVDNVAPHLNEVGALQLLQRADLRQDLREKMKVLIEENNPKVADALKNSPAWNRIESLRRGTEST